MKLDSKKSKAAVKNSAVKQKKVKAKAANPAKAPKVKKTLNTKTPQSNPTTIMPQSDICSDIGNVPHSPLRKKNHNI